MNTYNITGPRQNADNPAQHYLQSGHEYYQQGRYEEAIDSLRGALSIDPCNPLILYNLATALDEAGQLHECVTYYRRTLEVAPDMLMAYNNLGVALHRLGKDPLSRKLFLHIVGLQPHSADDYLQQSTALYNLGRIKKAVTAFAKAMELDANATDTYVDLYQALSGEKNFDKFVEKSNRRHSHRQFRKIKQGTSLFAGLKPAHIMLSAGLATATAVPAVLALIPGNSVNRIVTSIVGAAQTAPMPFAPVSSNRSVERVSAVQQAPAAPVAYSQYQQPGGNSMHVPPAAYSPPAGVVAPNNEAGGGSKKEAVGWDKGEDEKKYSIQAGPLGVNISSHTELEFNDNITSSGVSKSSDVIARLKINFDTELKLSKNLKLGMILGMSYQKYFDNSDLDSQQNFLNLGDNTGLSFKASVGAIDLEVYDKLTYSLDATDTRVPLADGGFDVNVDKFGRFVNTVGGKAIWEGKQLRFTGGLERQDTLPTEEQFNFSRSIQYNTPVIVDYKFARDKIATLNLSYINRKYPEQTNDFKQNDAKGYVIEPTLSWEPSKVLKIKLSAGIKRLSFSESGNNGDTSDASDLIYSLSVDHQINKQFSHDLTMSQDTRFGLSTNSEDVFNLRYGVKWQAGRDISFNAGLAYEHGKESGSTGSSYDRYVGEIGVRYMLKKNISLTSNYYFTKKDADTSSRSYDQNKFIIGVKYDF